MKALLKVFAVLLLFVSVQNVQAQSETSMLPILEDDAVPFIETLEEEGYEIVRMEFDILRDVKSIYRVLYPDYEYGILAFGDYRFTEVDVEAFVASGGSWSKATLLDKAWGEEEKYWVLAFIKPSKQAEYRFDIKAIDFYDDYTVGHFGFFLFHKL